MPREGGLNPGATTVFDLVYGAIGALALPIALGRSDFRARLGFGQPLPEPVGTRVQLHGVSVGEVKLIRPLLGALGTSFEPLLTSTTPAGLGELARLHPGALRAPFPIDLPTCVPRFFARAKPQSVVLLELELWPTFLRHAALRKIPVAVVNGRISERTAFRYGWLPEFVARRLGAVSLFAMQSEVYAERLLKLRVPPEKVFVCGNLKFDGLPDPSAPRDEEIARLLAIDDAPLLVGGSTHDPEEEILARCVAKLRGEGLASLRLVLVPRHIERASAIADALRPILGEPERLSRLRAESRSVRDRSAPILVDTIGDLEKVYRFATAAFVGGSLKNTRGGQNVLEPAALGVPVLHGPDVPNFAEAAELLAKVGASAVVSDEESLAREAAKILRDPSRATAAVKEIAAHRGAARRAASALRSAAIVR